MATITKDMRNSTLVESLRSYCDELGSQSAVSKKIGYSAAVISQYLQNKYRGSVAGLCGIPRPLLST